jgi:hypothetical protein
MPTTRARHMITETDEVEHALDEAALVWPDLHNDRGALLRRIIERGAESVHESREVRLAGRRAAIRETSGMLSGVYPPNAAQLLKEEWPE